MGVEEPNQIGDTLGGIMGPVVALLGVGLTFLAFWAQYVANQEQRIQFFTSLEKQDSDKKEQQFESQFFEMLRLHKENVDEMSIAPIGSTDGEIVTRRRVFEVMTKEFNELLEHCSFDSTLNIEEYEAGYNIFFWGFSHEELERLSPSSQSWFKRDFHPSILGVNNYRLHSGYSGQLGHYFRHLYMMVKFVVKSEVIDSYDHKMKYLKMLRAQLSNHEQIMLFYNWLSSGYGGDWEHNKNQYFTKYKMIHNLWIGELFQNQFIVDKVNGLIDKYNLDPKKKPLFEFQRDDFNKKMNDIKPKPLSDQNIN
ncbi:MAG: hypothetical protein NTW29_13240 [Bacteroidetes bacterium]|nr:hypothetical protein [Bacteroidota bacterium]